MDSQLVKDAQQFVGAVPAGVSFHDGLPAAFRQFRRQSWLGQNFPAQLCHVLAIAAL